MRQQAVGELAEPRTRVTVAKLKLLFGLSRTPHGLLDLATPAMAALLCLGHFPPPSVVIVGLITAFAGYTAVYALNDLVDFHVDKERLSATKDLEDTRRVDEIMVRHPLAQGLIPFRSGLAWFSSWALVALAGAWWLNPFCAALFVGSATLEIVYCKLLRITHLKVIPSAIVKATGGLAGVYAVTPSAPMGFVAVLFLWLAAWEVGGQNIPNDIVDMEADQRVSARTTLTVKGVRESVFRIVAAVSMAAFGGIAVYWVAGSGLRWIYPLGAVVLGWKLLLEPARTLYYNPGENAAASLFNSASYMPAAFLVLAVLSIYFPF
ncbi:MAG: UbiA family prenyltransferase [Desulfomonile tiedjei]|nr:UbiA family prenyltransferase [Desulfomonile tiedjei]